MQTRLAAAVAACLIAVAPAAAQEASPQPQPCISMAEAAANLAARYGERPAMGGLTLDGASIMIFANPESGTWTALLQRPGTRCALIVGAGTEWIAAPPAPVREEDA